MAQILNFPVIQKQKQHAVSIDTEIHQNNIYITKEMIENYAMPMFVFYQDKQQIGAATSLDFLRVCYSDRGAETAPYIGE